MHKELFKYYVITSWGEGVKTKYYNGLQLIEGVGVVNYNMVACKIWGLKEASMGETFATFLNAISKMVLTVLS